jgi:hypothetical protein
MSPDDAYAGRIYRKPRFRMTVDEWVAAIACIALGFGLYFGATHPQPQVTSCYQESHRP